jgi:ribosomal protein S27E
MKKLNRQIQSKDVQGKGYPFACNNCGNRPTPLQVIEHQGNCEICGDAIVAYAVDTAKYILSNEAPKELGDNEERVSLDYPCSSHLWVDVVARDGTVGCLLCDARRKVSDKSASQFEQAQRMEAN